MTDRHLPHDPYIQAVTNALTAAGLEPTTVETLDTEDNPYDDGPTTGGCMLTAWLTYDNEPGAVHTRHAGGLMLLWEHPAGCWQWAPLAEPGVLAEPAEYIEALPTYADPNAVVAAVRELLAGHAPAAVPAPEWDGAEQVRAAVNTWARNEAKDGDR